MARKNEHHAQWRNGFMGKRLADTGFALTGLCELLKFASGLNYPISRDNVEAMLDGIYRVLEPLANEIHAIDMEEHKTEILTGSDARQTA